MEKVCVNHPESPAVGSCKACEKPVCLMCIVEVAGVSFCSEACGSAYQEVKDWLERPAADEEWNPLAEAKAKAEAPPPEAAPVPAAAAPPPEANQPPGRKGPSGTEMRTALSTAFGENVAKSPDPIPQVAPAQEPGPATSHTSLYIALAATVLIIVGVIALFNTSSEPKGGPPVVHTGDTAQHPNPPLPPKPEPPKPEPVKPAPPKPEPVKPPPPLKPEPPKPEPVKPPPPPKPEPVKPEPPKPPPVRPEPPKPEPVKPPPPPKPEPPKPEPVKPEPPKPEPVKPPPPPKPEPVKPEPPKPEPVIAKPEPVKPPPPAPHLAFVRDPWGKDKAGAWYRIKTTTGGKESYRDIGLRESGAGYRVLVSQSNAGGKTDPEQFTWTEPEDVSPVGTMAPDVQGAKLSVDMVRVKGVRDSLYVLKDAPHAGVAFSSRAVLSRIDTQTVKVKAREFPCSVLEVVYSDDKRGEKIWFSPQFPLGAVRNESAAMKSELIDYGDDWAKRPPFPESPVIAKVDPPPPVVPKPEPPKPEPPKPEPIKPEPPKPEPIKPPPPPPPKPEPPKPEPVKPPPPEPPKPEPVKPEPPKPEPAKSDGQTRVKKSLADAAGMIREATPLYSEIAGSVDSVQDRAAIQDLVRKAERVQLKLGDARVLYTNVKADAPDPAVLERRVAQIDELLSTVQEFARRLKKRLE